MSDVSVLAHRYIHPEGLPSDYTITMLFRLLPDTPEEPFALWEILNQNNEPLVGVILDSESGISAVGASGFQTSLYSFLFVTCALFL